MTDPLTPIDVERKLRQLVTALSQAKSMLQQARDAEVDAKHAYEAAHRRVILSPECPRVERNGCTTAERDAWVAAKCAERQQAFDVAEAARKAAEDHLRVVRDQGSIVQTIARGVYQAYAMAGQGT